MTTPMPGCDPFYFEYDRPEVLALVPESARDVLDVGCGAGRFGAALKARQSARVVGLELHPGAAVNARARLDAVVEADAEADDVSFANGSFDAVVAADVLEHLRNPSEFLRRVRAWLRPDGVLIASLPNARHHSVVRSLLAGNWTYEPSGLLDATHLRFFTRREIEKLLYRAGLAATTIAPIPGPEHADWVAAGRPAEIHADELRFALRTSADAEEFFVYQWLIAARLATRTDRGLTSIVILTHNELSYTRRCVASILHLTDEPFELVMVDNGSTDGTTDYLRALAADPRVRVILNPDNRGFPAAANQGIVAATGRQILLLNNDTVVTTGWLDRMLRALHIEPAVGLVGPCSNEVSGGQRVAVDYRALADLDGFAWERGKAHDGVVEETGRLIGFCLLIRREVVDSIGLLDERFGIGTFEDDDYCLRAIRAGFRAVIARDAFIHHFGSRTFAGSGMDLGDLLRQNLQRFQQKWESAPLERNNRVALSGCLIVRDNARTIRACLESLRPWVDELVVVDTGSTDETIAIAVELGARVFHFPWCDDFSAARNESLRHARGEWVFWMDSDDTIDPENGRRLRDLACGPHPNNVLGYVAQVHCPGPGKNGRHNVTVVDHVKLIRNRPDLRFEGRIHEQLLPSIRRIGGEIAWADLFVIHSGYDHSPEGQVRKIDRDLRLLHLELAERPEHPFTLFNLGMTNADIGRYEEAAGYLERSIRAARPGESHLRKAYALLAYSLARLSRSDDALDACRRGLEACPGDPELEFRRGMALHDLGRLRQAEEAYLAALSGGGERYLASVDRGISGYKARHNLALVYGDLGDWSAAEGQWRRINTEVPEYAPGWRGLGEVLVCQGRFDEAAELAGWLMTQTGLCGEGYLLAGRVAIERGQLDAAREEFEAAARELPDDPEPVRRLAQVHFEARDDESAERALRDLVRRDPTDAAAHHNLGMVGLRRGRSIEAAEALRRSVTLRPQALGTRLALAQALQSAGNAAGATDAVREALALAPEWREAAKFLSDLTVSSPKDAEPRPTLPHGAE